MDLVAFLNGLSVPGNYSSNFTYQWNNNNSLKICFAKNSPSRSACKTASCSSYCILRFLFAYFCSFKNVNLAQNKSEFLFFKQFLLIMMMIHLEMLPAMIATLELHDIPCWYSSNQLFLSKLIEDRTWIKNCERCMLFFVCINKTQIALI